LSLIAVYYILKGVAYLIYYLFKGIGMLTYRLVSGIYYAFTGKTRPVKKNSSESEKEQEIIRERPLSLQNRIIREYKPDIIFYCSECGMKFTDKMMYQIDHKGISFCEHCGKGFTQSNLSVMEGVPQGAIFH